MPPEKVFKALSSTKMKAQWSAPEGEEIRFAKSNFRTGGVEVFKCGPTGALDYQGALHYEDIVKNERIVYTETVSFKNKKLASSLVTTELVNDGIATIVFMTIQVASYCGESMLKGCEIGYKSSLENLKTFLE